MTTERLFDSDEFAVFMNDFHTYVAGDWVITTTETGAGSATEAIGNEANGVLVITNDDADNDADFFQSVGESFKFASNKRLMFKSRFKVSDATNCEFVMGLAIRDTTPLSVSDAIYFRKDNGNAELDFHVKKDNTPSFDLNIFTVLDDTYLTLEAYYDGIGSGVDYYVNGTMLGALPLTNAPDDEELAITFGIQNGEAAAKVMTVDYIKAVQER